MQRYAKTVRPNLVGVVLMATIVGAVVHGQQMGENEDEWRKLSGALKSADNAIIDKLASKSSDDNCRASTELVTSHKAAVDGLGKIANTWTPNYSKETAELGRSRICAMSALGEISENNGLPILVRHIDFEPPMIVDEASFIQSSPAALALWRSGFACFPHIIAHLTREEPHKVSDRALDLYAYIFFWQCDRVTGDRTMASQLIGATISTVSDNYDMNLKRLHAKLKKLESQEHHLPG